MSVCVCVSASVWVWVRVCVCVARVQRNMCVWLCVQPAVIMLMRTLSTLLLIFSLPHTCSLCVCVALKHTHTHTHTHVTWTHMKAHAACIQSKYIYTQAHTHTVVVWSMLCCNFTLSLPWGIITSLTDSSVYLLRLPLILVLFPAQHLAHPSSLSQTHINTHTHAHTHTHTHIQLDTLPPTIFACIWSSHLDSAVQLSTVQSFHNLPLIGIQLHDMCDTWLYFCRI